MRVYYSKILVAAVVLCLSQSVRSQDTVVLKKVSIALDSLDLQQTVSQIEQTIKTGTPPDAEGDFNSALELVYNKAVGEGNYLFAENVYDALLKKKRHPAALFLIHRYKSHLFSQYDPAKSLAEFRIMLELIDNKHVFPEKRLYTVTKLAEMFLVQTDYVSAQRLLETVDPGTIKDTADLIDYYNSVGKLYVRMGVKEKSLGNFRNALKLSEQSGKDFHIAVSNYLISVYYGDEDDHPDSALFHSRQAVLAFQRAGYPQYVEPLIKDIGISLGRLGQYDSSRYYLSRAYTSSVNNGQEWNSRRIEKALGFLENEQGHYAEALKWCNKAKTGLTTDPSHSFKADCYNCLFTAFEGLGIYDSALYYHKLHHVFQDSMFSSKGVLDMAIAEANYERKLAEEEQAAKDERNKARLDRERYLQNLYLLGALLILAVALALVFAYMKSRKAKRQIEADKVYLDNLLHNLVHEFRTPLTLIQGPVQELIKKGSDDQLLQIVERNSNQMLNLVNQVLDFAKIKAGRLEVKNEMTNLSVFINEVQTIFKPFAESKSIHLAFDLDADNVIIGIDSDKLFKILSNLVSNAIKYTNPGGRVQVRLETANGVLKISVRDNGIGLKREDKTKIFEKFYQVDATITRKGEGTGLGLTFVKELVQLMGGQISVESKLGEGSTFYVLLPTSTAQNISTQKLSATYYSGQGQIEDESDLEEARKVILIIEDNADLRAYMTMLLSKDYKVLLAEDGQIGVEMAFSHIPDLVITDVMMPNKDGFQVVSELKNDPRTDHIPITVLTAKASFDSKMKGISVGADEYLSKPFSSDELILRINNQLRLLEKVRKQYQSQPDKEQKLHPFLAKLKETVLNELDQNLSAEDLAGKMALSRSQLHRKLTALTGQSTTQFVNHVKMERALEMLKSNAYNVSEVSYSLGYSDPAYFSKLFRKFHNVSPSEVLEKRKPADQL